MSAKNQFTPAPAHSLTFPDSFPQPPADVHIMPFKDFKERSICVEPGPGEEEVDTLGIPTIPLRTRHGADECKTNTKRKREAEAVKARKKGGLSTKKEWWEEWEDTEMIRFSTGFNPHSTRFERIHAAAQDFTNGRKWPLNFKSETGPRFIWEKFQRYIGIPEGGQTPKEKKKDDALSDDDMDEDDEDGDTPEASGEAIMNDSKLPSLAADRKAIATNEEKLSDFFFNPEKSIKIFLTSYARRMGYIWATENLTCMPRVLAFFVNFLLRSKVLPEIDRSLRRSLDIINPSLIELPNTATIAKATPDKFSLACNAFWGNKAESYTVFIPERDEGEDTLVPDTSETVEVIEEKVAGNEKEETTWSSGGTWGNSSDVDSSNPWAIPSDKIEEDVIPWTTVKEEDFFLFLGPTVLPLTHSTGIVERSMRRIRTIIEPNPNPPKAVPQAEGVYEPDADGVEVELDHQFTKIVLAPIIDWDGGEYPLYAKPTILQTSQGPVVAEAGAPGTPEGSSGAKPHDPVNDDIILLVENKAEAKLFIEGMAIGGTWVQLARKGESAKKKKKSKSKSKKSFNGYWYLDEVAIITPSFWEVTSD